MEQHTMVVVGAGLAGAKAAQTLRDEGHDGRILLVGDEPERPYARPGLSKGYLLGTATRDSLYVHADSWYAENDVDLRTETRVTDLDLATRQVVLDDGERIGFEAALLATGSSPRTINVPGAGLAGVHYLRRLSDSDKLHSALTGEARRVVVIGGGWIGLEVAAAARTLGHEVSVIEPQPMVLRGPLGDELGALFADLHRANGVRLILGVGATEFRGQLGVATAVVTTTEEEIEADLIVVGVGASPNTDLAQRAGLSVNNGVTADESLRTSHPNVFVAGDIANAFHPLLRRPLRVEHWSNALHSGPAAARSMLARQVSYDRIPYFYTDQFDLGMEYSGDIGPAGHDRIVYRGERDSGAFIAFWLRDDRVVAGMNVNVWDVADPIQHVIRSGAVVNASALADPDVSLNDFARST